MDLNSDIKTRIKAQSVPLEPVTTDVFPDLKVLNGISAVVFDVYGTMMISGVGDIGVDDGAMPPEGVIEAFERSGLIFTDAQNNVDRTHTGSKILRLYNESVTHFREQALSSGIQHPEPDIRAVWSRVLTIMAEDGFIVLPDQPPPGQPPPDQPLPGQPPPGPVQNSRSQTPQSQHPKSYIDHSQNSLFVTASLLSVEFEVRMNPVWPMPTLTATLQTMKRTPFVLGIISNSQFYTPLMLEALTGQTLVELGFAPDLLHWSFEEKMKKPGMDFYRGFLQKVSRERPAINPKEILYVGNDMLKDILPAHKLGMKTALFAGDRRSLKWRNDHPECQGVKPDIIVTALDQIPRCLSSVS